MRNAQPEVPTAMRVMLLITHMEAGGAQKALLQLGRGLAARGVEVSVACMYDKGGFVPRFSERYGIPILDLGMRGAPGDGRLRRAAACGRGLFRLARELCARRVQVLQTYSHYSNILGPWVARAAGVPVCVSSQRMTLRDAPAWLRRLDRLVANSAAVRRMVAVSPQVARYCEAAGIRADKLLTIANGVDASAYRAERMPARREALRRALDVAPAAPLVLMPARLHRQKGHRVLFAAVPSVLATHPDAVFLLAGDGPERVALEQAAAPLGRAVRFLGVRDDIPELLALCDVFVLPSHWEGMPNSVLEAMAAGAPVVATGVDGTLDVVEDGVTGLLVPPDDPAALARALNDLLHQPDRRTALAAAATRAVETRFSLEAMIDAYLFLYTELLPVPRHA